jgi:hypothetical protein
MTAWSSRGGIPAVWHFLPGAGVSRYQFQPNQSQGRIRLCIFPQYREPERGVRHTIDYFTVLVETSRKPNWVEQGVVPYLGVSGY